MLHNLLYLLENSNGCFNFIDIPANITNKKTNSWIKYTTINQLINHDFVI